MDENMLDTESEFRMEIDINRSIQVTPTLDWATIVLAVEDAHAVAIVEITQAELDRLMAGLQAMRGNRG